MNKRMMIAFWVFVFLCGGVALAAVATERPDPDHPLKRSRGLFSSLFDNY